MDFKTLASKESIEKTFASLKEHNFEPIQVETKEDALTKIKEIIPTGVSVMNGASETLKQIGYMDLLKSGNHPWNNLHGAIWSETDKTKQAQLRQAALHSDFYLGSAHSITETGEIIVASNSGSQLPHLAYTSKNIILVVGAQKITPTLSDGLKRIDEYVLPLESVRMQAAYGFPSAHSKTLILHKENPAIGRKIYVIIVNESLGF
jgi:L-lactate utilization protein LutC